MKKDKSLRCFLLGQSALSDEGPDFNAFCSVIYSYLRLWSLQLSLDLMGSLFLYAEKALMNSSIRILKSVMDLEKNYTYHFMAFPFNVVGNILHIREYKAIAFQYNIIWHKGSEYPEIFHPWLRELVWWWFLCQSIGEGVTVVA
ncbi:hypothetical protein TB2_007408 [Malus domestica]